jgi:hypothetical protein
MTLLPGVMVDVSQTSEGSNGYQGKPNQQHPEPDWRCAKFLCSEGGLLAFEQWSDQSLMRAITLHPPNDRGSSLYPDQQNLTQNQWFEASDQGDQGDQGTTPLKNEGVGDVPSEQDTPPKKRGEELSSTPIAPIAPIAFTQTQMQQGNKGVIRADQSTPIATDHPDHPDRLLRSDEWVSQLSQVANRDGTTYEAVKELGVPNNLRPEIFAALTVQVKERLKGLREEFERRIPQDIEKWRKAIATWQTLDANTLNAQWQQFNLWSQCLLGIGNWAERIEKSGLFNLAASVYSQTFELASEKSDGLVDCEVTSVNVEVTNEPKQLNLLPDVQPPSASENRFTRESEDWF